MVMVSVIIRNMLPNLSSESQPKFDMPVVLESRDWRSPRIQDLETAWWSPSHSLYRAHMQNDISFCPTFAQSIKLSPKML